MPADVSKPQSVPAMMRRGSPTERAIGNEPVGDDLGVLDEVVRGVDDPGHEDHPVRQRMALEAVVLVGVASVRHRQDQAADVGLVEKRLDVGERDVVGVRALVVPPADVEPDVGGIDPSSAVLIASITSSTQSRKSRSGRSAKRL